LAAPVPASQGIQASNMPQEIVYYGTIQKLPAGPHFIGTWVVSGKNVRVSKSTLIDQTDFKARLGAQVKVDGFLAKDGSFRATDIDVLS